MNNFRKKNNTKYVLTILCLLLNLIAYGQSKPLKSNSNSTSKPSTQIKDGGLKVEDYNYYFLCKSPKSERTFQQESREFSSFYNTGYYVVDIRTGKIVSNEWGNGKTLWNRTEKKLITYDGYASINFLVNSESGTKLYIEDFSSFLTKEENASLRFCKINQNFTKILFYKNNDFWISNINLSTGKIDIPRQITRFGFPLENQNFSQIVGWYKNGIGIANKFWFDEKSGDVKDAAVSNPPEYGNGVFQTNVMSSPNGRYINTNGYLEATFVGNSIWDLQTNTEFKFDELGMTYWADNNNCFLFLQEGKTEHLSFDDNFKLKNRQLLTKKLNESFMIAYSYPPIEEKGRRIFSPDGFKFISDITMDKTNWYIHDLKTKKTDNVDKSIENIAWINDKYLIYSESTMTGATVSEQGTYIYDYEQKSKKKLFSYLLDGRVYDRDKPDLVIYMHEANYVVFCANAKLWRCRPDGSELTSLDEVNSKLMGDSSNEISFKRFIDKVED